MLSFNWAWTANPWTKFCSGAEGGSHRGGRHGPQVQSQNEHFLGTMARVPGADWGLGAAIQPLPSCSAIVSQLSELLSPGSNLLGKLSSPGAPWASQGPSQGLHRPCSESSIFAASLQRREPPSRCRNKSWSHKWPLPG